jgi:hypothetical protein
MSGDRRPPLDGCRGLVWTRDKLSMASIDGQDLAERMFGPALTRVFGE